MRTLSVILSGLFFALCALGMLTLCAAVLFVGTDNDLAASMLFYGTGAGFGGFLFGLASLEVAERF